MLKQILCVAGPTASGKSASVLALHEQWPIEVINVDSATIYQGMDIGTAKPDSAERAVITHHLLDIVDPAQSYSVGQFCADTLALIATIQARNHIPVLVGGTMMYYKALREGLNQLPGTDPELRQRLTREGVEIGWSAMHKRLMQIDPISAARLEATDKQRIQRALEVFYMTGKTLSAYHAEPLVAAHDYEFITLSLEPADRSVLHQRIATRFDNMLRDGFVEEVARLKTRPDLHAELASMRCVGYRQIWSYLEGKASLAQAREMGIAATRQLAKRQLTWLRSLPERRIVDGTQTGAQAKIIAAVRPILERI